MRYIIYSLAITLLKSGLQINVVVIELINMKCNFACIWTTTTLICIVQWYGRHSVLFITGRSTTSVRPSLHPSSLWRLSMCSMRFSPHFSGLVPQVWLSVECITFNDKQFMNTYSRRQYFNRLVLERVATRMKCLNILNYNN